MVSSQWTVSSNGTSYQFLRIIPPTYKYLVMHVPVRSLQPQVPQILRTLLRNGELNDLGRGGAGTEAL